MKYWTGSTVYQYDWFQVFNAFWRRYPNPHSQHVLTEDIIDVRVKNGQLWVKKLISKRGKTPRIAQRFTNGAQNGYVIEETFVDLEQRVFTTYTRNINMQNVLSLHEKCVYTTDPSNDSQVLCVKQAWANSSITGFRGLLSSIGLQQYQKNTQTAALNYLLKSMYNPECIAVEGSTLKLAAQQGTSMTKVFYLLHFIKKIHNKFREILIQLKRFTLEKQIN